MSTYAEIYSFYNSAAASPLQDRIKVAAIVACDVIRLELASTTNHVARLAWARATLINPEPVSRQLLWAAIVLNRSLTTTQMLAATDAELQTAINSCVDLLTVSV